MVAVPPEVYAPFERYGPIPDAVSVDREVWEFLDEVKGTVMKAIGEIKQEISAAEEAHAGTTSLRSFRKSGQKLIIVARFGASAF